MSPLTKYLDILWRRPLQCVENKYVNLRCQFHQHFTCSFYACRSQKRQMTLLTWLSFFAHSGSTCIKAVRRTLMKLSAADHENFPSISLKFLRPCVPLPSEIWVWFKVIREARVTLLTSSTLLPPSSRYGLLRLSLTSSGFPDCFSPSGVTQLIKVLTRPVLYRYYDSCFVTSVFTAVLWHLSLWWFWVIVKCIFVFETANIAPDSWKVKLKLRKYEKVWTKLKSVNHAVKWDLYNPTNHGNVIA